MQRRRTQAAAALVDIVNTHPDGEGIVLRRFTKSSKRLHDGLAGILLGSDEEPGANEVLSETMHAGRLLTLLLGPTNVFHEALPLFLTSGAEQGTAGIRFLINLARRFKIFLLEEVVSYTRFALHCIISNEYGSPQWCHAVHLLEYLVRKHAGGPVEKQAFQRVLDSQAEEVFRNIGRGFCHEAEAFNCRASPRCSILQLIHTFGATSLDSLIEAMAGGSVANTAALIASNQVDGPEARDAAGRDHEECRNLSEHQDQSNPRRYRCEQPPFMRCLALAALVPLLEFEEVCGSEDMLFEACFDVMLGETEWQFDIEEDRVGARDLGVVR